MLLPPLSLYIHLPWCVKKCLYCDFNSHQATAPLPERAYTEALLTDLRRSLPAAQGRPLQSIFFGGGTPSLFSADAIHTLLERIAAQLPFSDGIEITLEANPGAVDQARFDGYRQAGVNRLSLGVQSFDDRQLERLGRIHRGSDSHLAIDAARQAGFAAINLDLMYGLPHQSAAQAMQDLQTALAHHPGHLSWYELTIEPNTAFYSNPPELPREQTLAELEQCGQALLREHGFRRYEISAYHQRNGSASRHNLNYWRFGDYLGIGAGAHGKISYPSQNRIRREWKTRAPKDYLAADHCAPPPGRDLAAAELPLEFMMNVLRLCDGVSEAHFERATGLAFGVIAAAVNRLREQGLLGTDRLSTTEQGRRFLDSILLSFSETSPD